MSSQTQYEVCVVTATVPQLFSKGGRAMKHAEMSRRRFLQIAGVVSGAMAVAACAPVTVAPGSEAGSESAPSAAAVTLTLWKMPHRPAGEEVAIAEQVLDGFRAQQADIAVEYTEVPWAQATEALTTAFASDDPPDISYQTEGISRYAIPGQLSALDDFFQLEDGLRESFRQQTFGPATINDQLYGMPWVLAGNVLLWNKDLFEQAGLDPERPPDTWDEIVEYGLALTKPEEDQFGFMIGPRTALEFHAWNTVFWPLNAGGRYTNEDFSEIYLDEEPAIAAAQFYGDLFNSHQITPPADLGTVTGQLMSMFIAGKGGFANEVNTAIAVIRSAEEMNFELGVGPKPAGPASDPRWQRAGYGAAGYLSIAANSPHQDEAWTLLKYLVTPDALIGWIKELGWQPVLTDLSFADGDPIIEAVEANLENAVFVNEYMPDTPFRGEVIEEFASQYESIAMGRKSAEEAMVEGAQRMRDIISSRAS
jgi:multiple sugar transport system substrate-binding protein